LSVYKSVTGIDEAGDFMINYPGDIINYQVAVKNNGDLSLTNVTVDDPMLTLEKKSGDNKHPGILDPGETWVYTGDYEVTAFDIDTNGDGTGFITNTAYATCDQLSEESSTIQVPIINNVDKQTDGSDNISIGSPVADFSTSVTSGYAPLSVQFTDKSTGSPTSWSWDFDGDGNADSSVQNPPAYTYNTAGTYTAKLTVSNANGSASKPEMITVLQISGSSNGSGGGESIGEATVISSSSSTTPASPNEIQTETSTPGVVQSTPPASEPTPAKNNTSKPVQPGKRAPGFEIVGGITALLGAIYLYRRR
jgi:PKD repeat protein